ncbi:MAG: GntR family transcriptional regulator [Gaiellaceae bacterium]
MRGAFEPVKRGRGPAHVQIEAALERAIASGELAPADRLPPERDLARQLRVSRMTLRQALRALEARGLVSRRVGRDGGTFVEEPKLELTGLAALSDQLRGLGREAGATVLTSREREATAAEEAALGAQRVFEVARVRSADGTPVALEQTVLPCALFPALLDQPLDGSLYALMRDRYGIRPARAVERLEPGLASRHEALALEIAPRRPVMLVQRTTYDEEERPVEVSRDVFRGDRTRVVWETWIAP